MSGPDWQWYTDRGLRAFPVAGVHGGRCRCRSAQRCPSPGKHPLVRGWQDLAGTTEGYVLWTPGDNVGVATGQGLVVLDWDGAPTVEAPATLRVATPSGEHWYFRTHKPVRNGVKVFDGILDIRGEGGFVVGPGSTHVTGKVYEVVDDSPLAFVPTWMQPMLQPVSMVREQERMPWPEMDVADESVLWQDYLTQVVDELASAPDGQRNHTLFKVTCRVAEMICNGVVSKDRLKDVAEVAHATGLNEVEIRRTIRSAVRRVADV